MNNDNTCPHCGSSQPVTVRDLIHMLLESTSDLDAIVNVGVESGDNMIVFAPFEVHNLDTDEDDDPARVMIQVETVVAWDTETNQELPAGVLVLEEPVDA